MHKLLERQIKNILGQGVISEETQRLINEIDTTYQSYDEDHVLLERSLELSSKEMVEINRRLKEIDRVKSEFISMASHQLRSPLTNVLWNAEMLVADDELGKMKTEQRACVEAIYHAGRNMTELIRGLLNVVHIELNDYTVKPTKVDVVKVMEDELLQLQPGIALKHLQIEKNFSEDTLPITADESLVRIVFQSLLSNAVKYSPRDAKIKIDLEQSSGKDEIVLHVSDHGCGIPESQHHRIFEKFFRADNAKNIDTDGLGLDLFIAKSILDYFSGRISFESKEAKGSTFHVSLPVKGIKAREGVANLDAAGAALKKSKIVKK